MKQIEKIRLLGLPLSLARSGEDVIGWLSEERIIVTYLSPFSYKVDQRSGVYKHCLERFDVVVADGVGIQAAARILEGFDVPTLTPDFSRIAGEYIDLFRENGWSVVLVGGEKEVTRLASARLLELAPGLNLLAAFSGYGEELSASRRFILAKRPECVIVGMGIGLQEKFLLDLKEAGWSGRGVCVGGMFDKLAYPRKDYPEWAVRMNVRFLGRIAAEPRRLWRRYLIDYQVFIGKFLSAWLTRRHKPRP